MKSTDPRHYKNFDVFEGTRFDFLKRVEFLPGYEFDFHTTEERLLYGIVLAIASSTHARYCADAHFQVLVSHRAPGVLSVAREVRGSFF